MKRFKTFFLALTLGLAAAAHTGVVVAQASQPETQNVARKPVAVTLPVREGSLKLAVFGDAGRGSKAQYELADLMAEYHSAFPFDMVLLTGDNIYGSEGPKDMKKKFEDPYKALIDRGVKFYASLGNHDSPTQRFYALFNMNGEEYYRIERAGVSFYALNTNYLDRNQLDWFSGQLSNDRNSWKIAFFHHPPFSSGGRHGSDDEIRDLLHPMFIKNGFDAVFTGHDHFYERTKPQDGLTYFVAGAAGKIRKGDLKDRSPLTAAGFDSDLSFMLIEFTGGEMHFQVISRAGLTVDSGVVLQRDP